jgi:hypothetical protein
MIDISISNYNLGRPGKATFASNEIITILLCVALGFYSTVADRSETGIDEKTGGLSTIRN